MDFTITRGGQADVLVVGGGTAGHVAALQAARAGADTVLVERGAMLGGTMTVGGIAAPAMFHCGGRQVIAGIGWELVQRAKELDGSGYPDFANPPPGRPGHHVGINGPLYALLAEEAARAAGVRLHYHELPVHAEPADEGWRLVTAGAGVGREIHCRELIDATGDATVVAMLGYPRVRPEPRQPGTLAFRLTGIDPAALDETAVQSAYEAALTDGRLRLGDWCRHDRPFVHFLRGGGLNAQHVPDADSSSAETQTAADVAGRESLLRLVRFVRGLPGCAQARLGWMSPSTTARETWQIVGETTITDDDYLRGTVFPDAVCYTYYFVDIHTEAGLDCQLLAPGVVPTIGHGALLPRGSHRLQVAGRSLACERRAHSALRVQASCMAMGQAAGAAAALGVRLGSASRDVPRAALRELLEAHGAIVP